MNRESDIFAEAIELVASERAAYLDRACGIGTPLRASVEALLRGLSKADRVFAAPVSGRPDAGMPPEKTGEMIGRYTLLEEIGAGGCGVVWRAVQREPVRREVALKVIKLGMDTREVVARFDAERQALALMDHPNIARVFDGGATSTGRPFFAMELVRGVPITRYCDENGLSTVARLELFIQVCLAVQHAHQKGIIHRDIKPSNILVTQHDDLVVPKVIDFGIAKATQGRLTDRTVYTAFEQFIGTPAYMSPEQAEYNAVDIDTRSDVYSLGVLLYELLTGRPPFDPHVLSAGSLEETRRVIREVDPPRPSAQLNTLDAPTRDTIARQRGTAPAQLVSTLRGDLDWIAMRCLEKNRARRYETANALAMDLQRHLRHQPVVARPPSTVYLLQKLIRRNRAAFGGIVAVASLILIVAVVSTWQTIRAAQRSSRADFKLGSRLLDEGNASEGLAHLVRAARSDPRNYVVGPRLISALVSRNFLLPERSPLKLASAVAWISPTSDGREVFVHCLGGRVYVLEGTGSRVLREFSFPRIAHLILAPGNRDIFAVHLADNSIRLCDASTGRERTPAIHPGAMLLSYISPRLSPDGRLLAAAGPGEVNIWDATSGALRATLPHREMIGGRPTVNLARVSGLDFSPDGRRIATSAENSYVRFWSVPDGKPLTSGIPIDRILTRNVRFDPDGKLVAACTEEGAQLYDAGSGSPFGPLLPHDASCGLALFAPDNRRLITASGDRTAKVWDVATGQLSFPPLRHGGPLYQGSTVAISNDGKALLTTGSDGFSRVWDMDTGQLMAEPALQQEPKSPTALSPDGRSVFVGTRSGLVFALRLDRRAARPLVLPRGSDFLGVGLAATPPARVRRFTSEHMEVIDVASGREVAGGFAFPEPVQRWGQARPDGRFLAVKTNAGRNEIWEVIDGRIRTIPLQEAPDGEPYYQFSPTGDLLSMAALGSRAVRVWSLRTGQPVTPPLNLAGPIHVSSQSFSPDGKRLAAGEIDGGVARVWDIASGRVLFDLEHARGQVNRVAFSPNGRRIGTTNNPGHVRLWNGLNGEPISPVLQQRIRADGAVFSPSGRIFATCSHDGTARVWDAGNGTLISETPALPSRVYNVQFNSDGSRIAMVSADGTARVWDAQTGLPLTEPMRHDVTFGIHDQILAANGQFSPGDGRFLCTFSRSRIFLWPVPPNGGGAPVPEWLLRLATICAGKRLTDDGVLVDATDEVAKIEEVRHDVAALPADAPFAEWGRWFLADRATRSIAPGFTITPAEAERRASELKPAK